MDPLQHLQLIYCSPRDCQCVTISLTFFVMTRARSIVSFVTDKLSSANEVKVLTENGGGQSSETVALWSVESPGAKCLV